MYTRLWHILTISQKLAEEQRSGPWWICQDEICIVHFEVEVRLFYGIFFRGTLHRLFQEDSIKKCSCAFLLVSFFVNRYQYTALPLLRYLTSFPSYLEHTSQSTIPKNCLWPLTFRVKYHLHQGLASFQNFNCCAHLCFG